MGVGGFRFAEGLAARGQPFQAPAELFALGLQHPSEDSPGASVGSAGSFGGFGGWALLQGALSASAEAVVRPSRWRIPLPRNPLDASLTGARVSRLG